LKARIVKLAWRDLKQLRSALPVIVMLKSGASMVLVAVNAVEERPYVLLQDPDADDGVTLAVDRVRFEEAWSGEVILVRRDYALTDEEKPFSLGYIAMLILRERRLVRDVVISAFVMGLFALAPIMFWRVATDKIIYYGSMNTFVVLCLAMAVVIIFEAMFTYLRNFLIMVISARVDIRLTEYMFDKVLKLPIDYFERTQVGIIGHTMNEMWKIRTFLTGQLFGTVLDSLMLCVFLPVMFAYSPLLTFVVLTFCGLIVTWLILMLPTLRRATRVLVFAESQRGAFLYQTLHGIRTVKSLALETRQRAEWDVHAARVAKALLRLGYLSSMIQAAVRPLERLAVTGSFALGVYLAITTNDPVYTGALFAFLMLSQRVSGPLMEMAKLVNQYDEARAAVAVVAELVNQPKEEGSSEHGVRTPLKGHVEFVDLKFRYPGSANNALDGISFAVPIGTTLGIVGRSGSGKTTVTRLLQRLNSDYEGLIKIDGVDVREYDVTHLRRSLGVVLQENFLFSGTIRENITAAKPHATFDEVVRVARLAGAEEFIDRLPRGFETYIYEGSPNLSGGQRQRLAIARALIVDPRILILDEATSALDPDSEAIVNDNIRRIAQGRTVIVVSHRLSSLVNSDAILVLERGKVADIGKHQELLDRCEIYHGLWSQQNRHIAAASRPIALPRGPARVS
jgi:ATP-binding cassette subfamily B protein